MTCFVGKTGNSNDGNTARKAFENYEIFAEIIEIDPEIVRILRDLLNAINCTLPLDADKFEALCELWLDLFFNSEFSWNVLNPSVHLLLVHGPDLIRYFDSSIGLYSEEGPEANNKVIRSEKRFINFVYFSMLFI